MIFFSRRPYRSGGHRGVGVWPRSLASIERLLSAATWCPVRSFALVCVPRPIPSLPTLPTSMPPSTATASNIRQHSPPQYAHSQNMLQPPALSPLVHECVDQFTSLPNELTRSFSDLRELDAVLRCTFFSLETLFLHRPSVLRGLPFVIGVRTILSLMCPYFLTLETWLLYFTGY